MQTLRFKVLPRLYKDSVSLMQIGATLRQREGISQAVCLMATPANLEQLQQADLVVDSGASPSDLLVVVRGEAAACDEALAAAQTALTTVARGGGEHAAFALPLTSTALGVEQLPAANLALISVPGEHAAAEASKALALGLHVMLFSDNVSVADERALKLQARARDLLVMGPDCGTAIVAGVPLGFANVVRRGGIGLVAASGTGLQEVTCRIHNLGAGISQALGTGGRDLKEAVGGITMLQGLAALAADAQTHVIVLISKPPAAAIAAQIHAAAAASGKPVVVHFLGASAQQLPPGLVSASSLRHAADLAVALERGEPLPPAVSSAPTQALAAVDSGAAAMAPSQRWLRALFTGGTFCYEAQLVLLAQGLRCRSNAPAGGAEAFDGRFEGHVLLDLGEDEYTRGRPHPMIDPSLRDAAVLSQAADAGVAAILFDLVLGYGAHDNPAAGLAASFAAAQRLARADGRSLLFIGHVCGTDGDPQGKAAQLRQLQDAGALVVGSNVEAALLGAHLAARRA